MAVIRVIMQALGVRVGAVVEKDASTSYAMLGPVMYATFHIRFRSCDVISGTVIIECSSREICHVAETIPLSSGLSVEGVEVVIC